jgi:DNA-binding NarL/FixJ family response regulator
MDAHDDYHLVVHPEMPMSIIADSRAFEAKRRPAQHPLRVLLVEDSPLIRDRLIESISSLDNVDIVGHADTAADAISTLQRIACDVVVLDLQLRAGHGFNVLAALRTWSDRPRITVIVLTDFSSPVYRERSMQSGADYFFDKARDYDRLTELLEQLAARRARNLG